MTTAISHTDRFRLSRRTRGFTLLELMIAAVLTLIMTALVVQVFGYVSDGVFNSRANIGVSEQLRNVKQRLIQDLRGITAPMIPPLDPWADLGYFEYAEGPQVATEGTGESGASGAMSIAGDRDDILMFTTANFDGDEYVGKANGFAGKSKYAEVAWYLRSNFSATARGGILQQVGTLHRRIFLVDARYDSANSNGPGLGTSYNQADQSMRQVGGLYENTAMAPYPGGAANNGSNSRPPSVVANSLGDLTMRERRSLHQPYVWPHEMMYLYGSQVTGASSMVTTDTTLKWQSRTAWTPGAGVPGYPLSLPWVGSFATGPVNDSIDNSGNYHQVGAGTSGGNHPFVVPQASSSREADDVILTNVLGFDVKVWDPGAPVFRATAVGGSGSLGVLVPGDPGYGYGSDHTKPDGALHRFMQRQFSSSGSYAAPVSFGAYVDLNYMWMWGETGTTNEQREYNYLHALAGGGNSYEKFLATQNGGNQVKLPKPSFAFARRGRPVSGFPQDIDPSTGKPMYTAYPAVYDTWSRHYEFDGFDNDGDGQVDEGTNGIDDNGNGFIDEPPVPIDFDPAIGKGDGVIDPFDIWRAEKNGERDAPPPYEAPLRGIKITIRVYEQDSKQVREISVVHEFVPL